MTIFAAVDWTNVLDTPTNPLDSVSLRVSITGGAVYEIRLSGGNWFRIRIASPN